MSRVPAPGAHGGDVVRVAAALGVPVESLLDLSVSLNPVAPDVVALARKHLASVRHYPDVSAVERVLADAMAVEPERLVLTAGGSQAIALVAAEQPSGEVVHPDFSLYERHLGETRIGAPLWRSDPHNPSGRLAPLEERAAVRDEAFYPLATGVWTRGDAGAVVVGSLTKLWACPGIRLGYVIAPDGNLPGRLRARRPEWAVSGLAAALLPELLERTDLAGWAHKIETLRRELELALRGRGLAPERSDAPWVLVPDAPRLRARLAAQGVLVRDCTSFGLPTTVRIGVPDAGGLERLAAALDRLDRSHP